MPEMIVCPVSLIDLDAERRILGGELLQAHAEPLLVALRLRLDGDRDDRLGELDRLEQDRVVVVAQRIAGRRVFEADRRGDVAGVDLLDLLALVGVHLQQAADALLACPSSRSARSEPVFRHARVDAEERQRADVRDRS